MSIFVDGGVDIGLVAHAVGEFNRDRRVGGQSIFVGQVRADTHPEGVVTGIEFTAHREMADDAVSAFLKRIVGHDYIELTASADDHSATALPRVFIRHGLGLISVGEAPLLIAVGTERRDEAFRICREILEALKSEVPIYGKELLDSESHKWKVNQ
jgi:molybdopterin synthase catalytic subunit